MSVAARPANNAVQSKNIWNESEIKPRLEADNHDALKHKLLYQ